ncbi:MAG: DUF7019 family protein [Gemmatimonadaceae bacterium]
MQIRDYVYVSDTKIDMLFDQIPVPLAKRITADLRIDLKVISVSVKQAPTGQTRYAKLAVVETFVREHLSLGTVDEGAPYVEGTLSMRWGPFGDDDAMVFFAGASEETVVGLGGSFGHVVGAAPPGAGLMWSAAPVIYRTLAGAGALSGAGDARADAPGGRAGSGDDDVWPRVVAQAARTLAPPTERLEFLARRIRRSEYQVFGRSSVLLGSPIYVARDDQ